MSLRVRTTLLVAVVAAALLLGGAVTLQVVLRHRLTESADDLARSRVADLLTLARSGTLSATLVNVTDDSVAQVVDDTGLVVAASANAQGAGPLTDEPTTGGLHVADVVGPDDRETEQYRLWSATGPAAGGGRVRVYVGTSLESVREATASLRAVLRVGVPLLWLLLVGATWLLVGHALRRLDRIRAEVDNISEADLSRRVGASARDDEVGRLAATMNRMLDRLERAAERQREFVADVSHDLGSPLTAQRTQLEVAMAHPDPAEDEALHRDLLGHVTEMEALVGDLLFVATEDERPLGHEPVDLEDLVLEEAARARRLGDLVVDTSGVSAAPVLGDATRAATAGPQPRRERRRARRLDAHPAVRRGGRRRGGRHRGRRAGGARGRGRGGVRPLPPQRQVPDPPRQRSRPGHRAHHRRTPRRHPGAGARPVPPGSARRALPGVAPRVKRLPNRGREGRVTGSAPPHR